MSELDEVVETGVPQRVGSFRFFLSRNLEGGEKIRFHIEHRPADTVARSPTTA
jgi:hypothetical protein